MQPGQEPQQMEDGVQLDQNMLIQVLQQKLATAAVTEAQMESAIQTLAADNKVLMQRLSAAASGQDAPVIQMSAPEVPDSGVDHQH